MKHSSTKTAIQDATDDIIHSKPVSIPHTTNMLDNNVTDDNELQSFSIPSKNTHSATSISAQVIFLSDTLQCQHNSTTRMTGQKLPPSGN